uniref:ARAD1D36608p n=1 Tax=Blastobotrys adeninivorans TaxID=409370 RepID=A0A060TBP1_BLAAD
MKTVEQIAEILQSSGSSSGTSSGPGTDLVPLLQKYRLQNEHTDLWQVLPDEDRMSASRHGAVWVFALTTDMAQEAAPALTMRQLDTFFNTVDLQQVVDLDEFYGLARGIVSIVSEHPDLAPWGARVLRIACQKLDNSVEEGNRRLSIFHCALAWCCHLTHMCLVAKPILYTDYEGKMNKDINPVDVATYFALGGELLLQTGDLDRANVFLSIANGVLDSIGDSPDPSFHKPSQERISSWLLLLNPTFNASSEPEERGDRSNADEDVNAREPMEYVQDPATALLGRLDQAEQQEGHDNAKRVGLSFAFISSNLARGDTEGALNLLNQTCQTPGVLEPWEKRVVQKCITQTQEGKLRGLARSVKSIGLDMIPPIGGVQDLESFVVTAMLKGQLDGALEYSSSQGVILQVGRGTGNLEHHISELEQSLSKAMTLWTKLDDSGRKVIGSPEFASALKRYQGHSRERTKGGMRARHGVRIERRSSYFDAMEVDESLDMD